jgi:hypothetical protein
MCGFLGKPLGIPRRYFVLRLLKDCRPTDLKEPTGLTMIFVFSGKSSLVLKSVCGLENDNRNGIIEIYQQFRNELDFLGIFIR